MKNFFENPQSSYRRLRAIYAERTKRLIIWTGAGLSNNLPTWKQLRDILQKEAYLKASTFNEVDRDRKNKKINSIEKIENNWVAFEQLKEELGETSYKSTIKEALTPKIISIPTVYKEFWNLKIGGMLTSNLDRFTALSYTEEKNNYGKILHEIKGQEVANSFHILQSDAPFVVNLHGILEDYSSWIFTKSAIDKLLRNSTYKKFITSIFATKVVLFSGISADDIASGGILFELKRSGIDFGEHFWLTDRNDEITDQWAENAGIQIIRYPSDDGHDKAYQQIFADLKKFIPEDVKNPEPIIGSVSDTTIDLPAPGILAGYSPEIIRQTLSIHSKKILSDKSNTIDDNTKKYNEFCKQYQRAIYNSWYISDQPPENIFFGYEIETKIGGGAFGNVYKANKNGHQFAIKLLREEIKSSPDMLGSFRRGVRSMRILDERGVKGMVPYIEAYELPPCAIMDFIDGPNLEEAVRLGKLDRWVDGLKIALEVAKIVRSGHLLPERVLHRDIRPANIMLRNYYNPTGKKFDVVVLDFDLSWHRGSTERSIDISNSVSALGYVAPEQIENIKGISTRNAAVDSFGFAMTLLFLFSHKHPLTGESYKTSWESDIKTILRSFKDQPSWKSLPDRISRLIARSTYRNQNLRMDMGQIEIELDRLCEALLLPDEVQSAELWAEEITRRAFPDKDYDWNPDKFEAKFNFPNSLSVSIIGNEIYRNVTSEFGWAFSGDSERRTLDKYLPKIRDQIKSILRKCGWQVDDSASQRSWWLKARVDVEKLKENPEIYINSLKELPNKMTL